MNIERQYLNLMLETLENGCDTSDRTGTGTFSQFGPQIVHNFSDGFPLLTTKKVFWKGVVEELLWMLRGETNVKSLQDKGVHIWDEWADENGDLGPVYGQQWRLWRDESFDDGVSYIDQIEELIGRIKTKPDCRRLIVTAWNPADVDKMKLPPCHCFFQFKIYGNKLSCKLYQRSADSFLGVPFNIASYALLTCLVAKHTGLEPGSFIHSFGDFHVYKNHVQQVKEQCAREPRPFPSLKISDRKVGDISNYTFEDFQLIGYDPHPAIKAEVSV